MNEKDVDIKDFDMYIIKRRNKEMKKTIKKKIILLFKYISMREKKRKVRKENEKELNKETRRNKKHRKK